MFSQRYRLKSPTVATIFGTDGRQTVIRIPAGTVIVMIDSIPLDSMEPNAQVNVEWGRKIATMFVSDIRKHAERVDVARGRP